MKEHNNANVNIKHVAFKDIKSIEEIIVKLMEIS